MISSTRSARILDPSEYHVLTNLEENIKLTLTLLVTIFSFLSAIGIGIVTDDRFAALAWFMVFWTVTFICTDYWYNSFLIRKYRVKFLTKDFSYARSDF